MMTEIEIDKLAQDVIDEQITFLRAVQEDVRKKYMPSHKFSCPRCKKANVGNTKLEEISECFECGTLYGENYQFVLPTWARKQSAHFRRFVALSFNIQGK